MSKTTNEDGGNSVQSAMNATLILLESEYMWENLSD